MGFGTPRLGDKVVELHDAGFAHDGGARPVLARVDLDLDPVERLGIVGANGTGKSTLLDLIAGRRAPTSGRVETGTTVVVGYYDQRGVDLDLSARVRDLVAGPTRVAGTPEDNRLMERFWFTGELQFARAGTLSGGERRRLQLLLVLAGRPNLLLLDEPTNDLDLDTLRILEDFLEEWPGALVTVSHDRTFLDRTTDRILALDGAGSVAAVAGGLSAWVAGAEAAGRRRGSLTTSGGAHPPPGGEPAGPAPDGGQGPSGPRGAAGKGSGSRSASTIGHQLRAVDKELARLQRRRDQLNEALVAPAADHLALARLGDELTEVQLALQEAEERWLLLAEEAEARR
jgi:ATP-binding cassette subfamily F protein uup